MVEGLTSAATVGAHMPATLSLDDLAAMADADGHGHGYEMSPEGVLSIMPPPNAGYAVIANRLLVWLVQNGWPLDQVLQNCGLRVATREGTGGRVPDLMVLDQAPATDQVWATTDGLRLAVEIVSKSSVAMAHVTKRDEYAAAGVARYCSSTGTRPTP